MFSKKMMKTAKWVVIGGFAADAVCIAAAYYGYHQMRNSTEFRYKVYDYDQRIVDVYYRANEKYGDGNARKEDYKTWGIDGIKSYKNISLLGL